MCTYRHFSPTNTVTSLDTLLKLFSCTHHEWLREPTRDMNCLLCWGPDTLVRPSSSLPTLPPERLRVPCWLVF